MAGLADGDGQVAEMLTSEACTVEKAGMVLDVPEAARGKLRELIRRKQSRTRVALAMDASP